MPIMDTALEAAQSRLQELTARVGRNGWNPAMPDLRTADAGMVMARKVCKSKGLAWSRLRAEPPQGESGGDAILPSELRKVRTPPNDPALESVERLHRLQSVLSNSWALYELVWGHVIWPLLLVQGKAEPPERLKALTNRGNDSSFRSHGWIRFALWNAIGTELDLLWQLRCVAIHEPAALLGDGAFETVPRRYGLSWQISATKLLEILGNRPTEDVRDAVRREGDVIDLATYVARIDSAIEHGLAEGLRSALDIASAGIELAERLSA